MLSRVMDYLIDFKDRQRISIALAKGGASMLSRQVELRHPKTWEFSGFSQNGEDGILDVLRRQLLNSNRYVVEIGAADGTENNSSWLLVAERYDGLLIEGDPRQSARAKRNIARYSIGSECFSLFVTLGSVDTILSKVVHSDPDVFSLDIDGNDYHVAKAMFDRGFRPKITSVEYNSAFGPHRSITSRYKDDFRRMAAHSSGLYYGVSLCAWRNFLEERGYRFMTVDSKGVNAFFVDPAHFDGAFIDSVVGISFEENRYQQLEHGCDHVGQFAKVADQEFEQV